MPRALGLDSGNLDWGDLYRILESQGMVLERAESLDSAREVLTGSETVDLLLIMGPAPPLGQVVELIEGCEPRPGLFLFEQQDIPLDLVAPLEALGAWVFVRPWPEILLQKALVVAQERVRSGMGGVHMVDDLWFEILSQVTRRG
jgi:hypothetical protein